MGNIFVWNVHFRWESRAGVSFSYTSSASRTFMTKLFSPPVDYPFKFLFDTCRHAIISNVFSIETTTIIPSYCVKIFLQPTGINLY